MKMPLQPPLIHWGDAASLGPSRRSGRFAVGMLLIWAIVSLLALIVISRSLAGFHVAFDVIANINYFLGIPLLAIALVAACTRQWLALAGALVAAVISAAPLLSPTGQRAARPFAVPTASVLHCNIRGSLSAWESLRVIMDARQPDLVSVVEVSEAVIEQIRADERLLMDYPHRVLPRHRKEWPQVLLSRHPMQPLPVAAAKPGTRMLSLFSLYRSAVVSLPIGDIIFSTEHVPSPRTSASWKMGNEQIVALGHVVRDHYRRFDLPVLVTGDFNSSPTGYRDGLMRSATGLLPNPESFPPRGTWPSLFPPFLRLPLDRAWASEQISFGAGEVLTDIGSDHRPLLMRFS
ncbi:MAG: endonuclease/exonuclease/phosphatase family protein, partial [Planctomycetes bacterium]|nr:endonuclease/exonuclease/phosphatase family protein [Planctomycetota bacterium]